MSSKINVFLIVRDHLSTLRDEATGKISTADLATMFGIPAIFAALSLFFDYSIDESAVAIVVAVFAIFAGLLLNVLVLIYGLTDDPVTPEYNKAKEAVKKGLLRQSFSNISYAILISLLVVVVVWVSLILGGVALRIDSAVFALLAVHFFLTLLMILKRMHILLRDRFVA